MKITKEETEDLKLILEEYLTCFKKMKKHEKEHKKISCPLCDSAKRILKKLK